ncbi:hypothetical protein [Streptomyces sp. NPDC058268]|uniref:hypothetical protein n=1 Tax=Streptomyces sp. NPDC058268 TaxID=3346413 RepID=UPI0036E2E023
MTTATLVAGALGAATAPAAAESPYGDIRATGTMVMEAPVRPVPGHQQAGTVSRGSTPGELADTGGESDTMLYAGLAISLFTLGVLAVAAARSRRDQR